MKDYISEAIIGLLGVFGSLITYWQTKRKSNAEIDQIVVNSVKSITDEFKDLIDLLKKDSQEQREHRTNCEESIESVKKKSEEDIRELKQEIESIKSKCKHDCYR
jgi:phenylalanyl-tRNA synthetase alpha subunit